VDQGKGIATDANGNIYVVGYFSGTMDVDPGIGVVNLTAADTGNIFVAKYDNGGNYIWAFTIGGIGSSTLWLGNEGASIKVDGSGNVVVRGAFQGTADFDPGTGTTNLTATPGTNDMFVGKYTPTGNLLWAFRLPARIRGLDVDGSNNIIVCGSFQNTVDFNPGTGTTNLTAARSTSDSPDMFVAKYSATGGLVWAFGVGASGFETCNGVAVDGSGNCYVTGYFGGTSVNFNPGSGPKANLSSSGGADMFLAKYSSAGKYLWAFSVGSAATDQGIGLTTDGVNVWVTGAYGGTADFNPGTGTNSLASVTSQDIFVARYSSSGAYGWAIGMGDGWGTSVVLDGNGDLRVSGNFKGTDDFDPGTGTASLTSLPATDFNAFVAKYTYSGGYLSVFGLPGTTGAALALDGNGGMFVTGGLKSGANDFDPDTGVVSLTLAGVYDCYIAKYTDVTLPKFSINTNPGRYQEMKLGIAPNPFTSGFTVSYDGAAAPARIEIIDMMGRVVESREMVGAGEEIMLGAELPAGAYLIEIVQGEERRTMMIRKVK
jgi:hypothetical protein